MEKQINCIHIFYFVKSADKKFLMKEFQIFNLHIL